MLKNNIKLMSTLALVLSLSLGAVTVSAAETSNKGQSNEKNKIQHKIGMPKEKADLKTKKENPKGNVKQGMKMGEGLNPARSILKTNLGFTDAQIQEAAKAGKTAFDLAAQKGTTADQLKTMIIDAQSKKIDAAVTSGKLTQVKADTMKADLKTKIQSWDGKLLCKPEPKKPNEGMKMGEGFNPARSILKTNLGFTDAQIQEAAKAGKTAFDLAAQKGTTADQLKTMIIDAQSKKIDTAVTSGKLTQAKADAMKADLKTKIQSWDGSLGHKANMTKEIKEAKVTKTAKTK